MSAKRTLLNHQDRQQRKLSKPGTENRNLSPELIGTKTYLERVGVPPRSLKGLAGDLMYRARLHFTKGWRISPVRD